jgi:hypothetical protein
MMTKKNVGYMGMMLCAMCREGGVRFTEYSNFGDQGKLKTSVGICSDKCEAEWIRAKGKRKD